MRHILAGIITRFITCNNSYTENIKKGLDLNDINLSALKI